MTKGAGPLVCVCVPTYNSGRTLPGTLDSIINQTYRNLKVFIVDNASTDNTLGISRAYAGKDSRIEIIRHAVNVGGAGNFTKCLQLACGEYTAIFHSDDIYTPSIIMEQVAFLEKYHGAEAVFVMAESIDAGGQQGRIYRLPAELRRPAGPLYVFPEVFRVMLKYGNFLFCPGAMARTTVYRDYIKELNETRYASAADGDVWLRILQRGPIGIIDKPLLKYRISPSSFSYHLARGKTGPHDMVRLFDDYIKGFAAGFIGAEERKNYELMVLRDNINRAFNLLLSGKRKEAGSLLSGVF